MMMQLSKELDISGCGKEDQTEIRYFSYKDLKEELLTLGMQRKSNF